MTETPAFIGPQGARLFTVFHDPAVRRHAPVVFCHPFAEEKLWTHRVFVTFARMLAEAGYPVVRFDLRGNGDSDGRFEESSVTTAAADVRSAIDHAKHLTGVGTCHLLGLRFGATIAARVAAASADLDQLILWAPVLDGAAYMKETLRINLSTQVAVHKEVVHDRDALVARMKDGGTTNIDGYELAWPFFSEASSLNLLADGPRHGGPCLIVDIDRAGRRQDALARLAASYPAATLAAVQEDPFWKEIPAFYGAAPRLFAVTRDWQASVAHSDLDRLTTS